MYKHLLILITVCALSGCTVFIKTPIVADYEKLDEISAATTRNDIELMLGTPQAIGVHSLGGREYDLTFYYGMAGKFSARKANMDSGTAFITFENSNVRHALYFLSDYEGPPVAFGANIPIIDLAEQIRLGVTSIDEAITVLGPPMYEGRRIDAARGLIHSTSFWDISDVQNDRAILEKWLVLGYDDQGIIHDLMWASSVASEVKKFGEVIGQRYNEYGIFKPDWLLAYYDVQSIGTTNALDAIQVEALLKRKPTNIQDFKDVLGNPTALGIKVFKEDEPMVLSNWSFSEIEAKGRDSNYAEAPYMVIEFMVGRLLVAHTEDGLVKEIWWFKPE